MKTFVINNTLGIFVGLLMVACNSGPKLAESETFEQEASGNGSKNQRDMPAVPHGGVNEHNVVVEEVLNTEKYSYLNVTEDGNTFWIAIPRKEVEIGGMYSFQGGLLKRNFESKEYNRVFETIYLVQDITQISGNSGVPVENNASEEEINTQDLTEIKPAKGSITLSELFSNREKYRDKAVQVTGRCVKFNPGIMGRNWIHVQDGSGEGLDLTITTTENTQIDDIVTFVGIIALDKDFGAGYKYDIILEKAILK